MIEIGEVRHVVHAYPFKRLAALEARAHRLEIRAVGPNLFVAIHADRGRRHSGRRRCLDSCMAITAIDSVIADVMFMTELNWLLALDVSARVPTRAGDFRCYPQRSEQNKNCAKDRRAREIVCAVTKNLWHRRLTDTQSFRRRTDPPIVASGRDSRDPQRGSRAPGAQVPPLNGNH